MLNFKSAEELGLSKINHEALIAVLLKMERGELVEGFDNGREVFNMACVLSKRECGTVGCIAGWAYVLSGERAFKAFVVGESPINGGNFTELGNLFYGPRGVSLDDLTLDQARHALSTYLTTGHAEWNVDQCPAKTGCEQEK